MKIAFSDYDGTLSVPGEGVPAETIEAVRMWRSAVTTASLQWKQLHIKFLSTSTSAATAQHFTIQREPRWH